MQGGANGNCGERQTEHATSHAQQESLSQRLANNSAGTRANRKANRIFAPLTDSPYQEQAGDIHASNQEHDGYSQKQGLQYRTNVCHHGFAQWLGVALNLNRLHACGKIAHYLVRHSVGILSGLPQGYSVLQPSNHVVAPEA